MPDKRETSRSKSRQEATTPDDFPVVPPTGRLSALDHSFLLQAIMESQAAIGKLTASTDSLKDQVKEQGLKLEGIGKDVHAAKVVVSVVGGLIALFGALIAWLVNTYISTHPTK